MTAPDRLLAAVRGAEAGLRSWIFHVTSAPRRKALLPARTAVPTSPSGNIIRQALPRDVAQRLINPGMGLCVQRRIVSKAEKRWNCAVALLLCKHARLRQAARRALPHHGRSIVVQSLQERRNRIIASQIRQSFHCPMADFRI